MDKEIEKYVQKCDEYRMVALPDKTAPLKIRRFPLEPWCDIAMDFMGPLLNGKHLLVVIDYYSRYLEAVFMNTITAEAKIRVLRRIFVCLGNPTIITLDNGRQFVST